jgi:DNA end-binding protein Ku
MPRKTTKNKKTETKEAKPYSTHSIWSGAISFGLVNIPIRLYSATGESGLNFDMLHKDDLSPIRYARICKEEEVEVPYPDIVKGFEIEKGHYVVLEKKDFERVNVAKTKTISITDFTDIDAVDPIYLHKSYYLEPEGNADQAYALLREALLETHKVGVATFVLRNRENLGMLEVKDDVLVLTQLRYAHEIRDPKNLHLPDGAVKGRELEMAKRLVNELAAPFNIKNYHDSYTEELKEVIAKKAQGKTVKAHGKAPQPTQVKDLMAALKASLEKKPAKAGTRS